jgi:hypothetical protein
MDVLTKYLAFLMDSSGIFRAADISSPDRISTSLNYYSQQVITRVIRFILNRPINPPMLNGSFGDSRSYIIYQYYSSNSIQIFIFDEITLM